MALLLNRPNEAQGYNTVFLFMIMKTKKKKNKNKKWKKKNKKKNTKLAKNKKQCNKFDVNIKKIKQLKAKITSSLLLLFKCNVQDPSVSRNQKYCRQTRRALKMFFFFLMF